MHLSTNPLLSSNKVLYSNSDWYFRPMNRYVNFLISKWLGSRVFRNILFWLILGITNVLTMVTITEENMSFLTMIKMFSVHLLMYAPAAYLHNLILLPKYFLKKQYVQYYGLSLVLILINTFFNKHLLINFMEDLPQELQGGNVEHISYGAVLITNFIWIGAFGMVKLGVDWLSQRSRVERLEKEHVKSELDLLKSKMNPHFLFNGLNTIYGLSIKKDELTSEAILMLSEIMRYVIYDCNADKVKLSDEAQYIQNYINFGKLRRKNAENIHFTTKGKLKNKFIAPLLVIPFIENAFKHGYDSRTEDAWIKIELETQENEVVFRCSNSALKHKDHNRNDKGIGIENIRKRLAILYPNKHNLILNNLSNSFEVELKLDLNE